MECKTNVVFIILFFWGFFFLSPWLIIHREGSLSMRSDYIKRLTLSLPISTAMVGLCVVFDLWSFAFGFIGSKISFYCNNQSRLSDVPRKFSIFFLSLRGLTNTKQLQRNEIISCNFKEKQNKHGKTKSILFVCHLKLK